MKHPLDVDTNLAFLMEMKLVTDYSQCILLALFSHFHSEAYILVGNLKTLNNRAVKSNPSVTGNRRLAANGPSVSDFG